MMNRAATMLTDEEKLLVDQCAMQLRMIQADAVTLPASKREEYLAEAISRTFKDCTPADRERLLQGLLERFPVAGRIMQNGVPRVAEAVVPRDTPETMLEKLIQSLGAIPVDQRAVMAKRLADAGLSASKGGLSPNLQVPPELLQKVGLTREQSFDLERLVQVAGTLIQLLNELDRTAQTTLREVKRQTVHRSYDLQTLAGEYLAGRMDNLEQGLRPTAAILGALMAGILGGGREFGRQFSQKYSPEMIEQIVESEGKKGFMGPSADERSWQKYKKLYRDIESPDAVDRWFKDCLAKFIDLGGRAAK